MEDGRRKLSYADLNARTNSLANSLAELGLKKGDNVAVLLGNRVEHVEVLFALAKSGLTGLPIDPKWRGREISAAIKFFDVAAVILESSVMPSLADALSRVEFHGPIVQVDGGTGLGGGDFRAYGYEQLIARENPREPEIEVGSTDVFLIMITSGTTGFPKGCLSTHEKYVLSCLNHALGGRGSSSEDIELLVSPLCFNSGRSSALGHLFWGGTVILRERFDPVDVLETIQRDRVTYIALAPVAADRLLNAAAVREYDTSSLRHLRKAGSPFHPRTVDGLIQFVTPNIYQSYASTDAGSVSLLLPEDQIRKRGSSGKLIWAAESMIMNDAGEPLPTGSVGEIVCRGPLVCAGYYKNPEANQTSFRNGWFLTGDLGYFDEDGYLYVVGRKKNVIKSGSVSIFPDEIQDVLQAYPKVNEVAVVGVPHREWGEAVVAVISLASGQQASEQEMIEHCRSQLAPYKAPKAVRFLKDLPHTELGKIATEEIRTRFRDTFAESCPGPHDAAATDREREKNR
ncbi:MAG: AMP-binding protein [Deltaproteobacteria bacterium]|nr:AMP-binding protein [Deltaproteobacteria bacterium]